MKPPAKPAAKPKPKAGAIPPGIEAGDHVYVRGASGPMAVRVLAHGKDGMTCQSEDKQRHRVGWDRFLGHKARMLHRMKVVDQGADGAIVEDDTGRRRYLEGRLPAMDRVDPSSTPERAAADQPERKDDPLLGGMGRLKKATSMEFPDKVLFLKAEGIKFAPRAGDRVEFRSDQQTDKGPSSGKVTSVSDDGLTAMIRHSDAEEAYECPYVRVEKFDPSSRHWMLKAESPAAARPGLALRPVTDKAGHRTQRWVRTMKDQPKGRQPGKGDDAPMQHGDVVGFRHGDVEGKGKVVGSGADGVTVQDEGGREHQVRHEHLTGKAADEHQQPAAAGAKPSEQPAAGGDPAPLFPQEEVQSLPNQAQQPFKDKTELFAKSKEALDHLAEWLDREKGIASKMGFQTITTGMDGADLDKPGGMLFLAPIKGEKRAAEKVASDYGGDWSKLLDTVRRSLAVDSFDDVQSTLAALQQGGMKLARQPKDRFNKPLPVGYRDLLLNVTFPNGLIGEVQVHVKPMLKAKEEGHKHYEAERTLQSKKAGGDAALSDDERRQLEASIHAQTAIYGDAWKAASATAEGQSMSKALEGQDGADGAGDAFDYFDHDNAQFRRKRDGLFRSVDDVLIDGKWTPYKGSDSLAPALYGDEIPDPLATDDAGAGGEEQMAKGGAPMILFLKSDPDRYAGSADDDREDERNAKKHGMTVAEWQKTKADKAADAAGQRRLDKKDGKGS